MTRGLLVVLALAVAAGPVGPAGGAGADEGSDPPAAMPTGVEADYQIGGPAEVPDEVGIVVRDRRAEPTGDRYDVCYVNAFQTQPDERALWRRHPRLVLRDGRGRPVVDGAWDERLLDVRTRAKRRALARIVDRWVRRCADDGFDAVEYDNLDSFTRSRGLLRPRHARHYARMIVRRAHDAGLAAAQKNRAAWDGTAVGFDLAVAEECGRYRECESYLDHYGDQVIAVEYRDRDFERACAAVGARVSVVRRDRAVTADGVRRWC